MILAKLNIHIQINELWPKPHTYYKNELKSNILLNVKYKTTECLETNRKES